jgi:hypothetical protein
MKKKIFGVFVCLLVFAILTFPISVGFAKKNPKFIDVSGQLRVLQPPTGILDFRPAGNSVNQILTVTGNTLNWTGSFENSLSIADGRFVITKGGSTSLNKHIMAAEFMGLSGTLTIITSMGGWRIISGTGDFANCHGQGKVWGIVPPVLWGYEGQIHFDP